MKIKQKITVLLTLFASSLIAQSDMDLLTESGKSNNKEYVSAAFKSTRLINMHTLETQGKGVLNFIIAHRFGNLNDGAYNLFGLDGGAIIRMGLEFSYDGRLELAIGRTSTDKMLDGYAKYRLLRQTIGNSMPVSITLYGGAYYTMARNRLSNGYDVYSDELNRLSYCAQAIVGRKFSEKLSFQIAPYLVYYNLVKAIDDNHLNYGVAAALRFKITKRAAITAEYGLRLNNLSPLNPTDYKNCLGVGFDLETGGHVFQVHLTNGYGLIESQFLIKSTDSWKDFGIRLGFNVNRAFAIIK